MKTESLARRLFLRLGPSRTVPRIDLSAATKKLSITPNHTLEGVERGCTDALIALDQNLPQRWRKIGLTARISLFAMAAAHSMKPYGPGSLPNLTDMLAAETLDCSNYGFLMHHILRFTGLDMDGVKMVIVGWDGDSVGNHQVVFLSNERNSSQDILLDATYGIAALANFDEVASGRQVESENLLLMADRGDCRFGQNMLVDALINGRLRPSELLYYFEGFQQLEERFGHPDMWPTPGAANYRSREQTLE